MYKLFQNKTGSKIPKGRLVRASEVKMKKPILWQINNLNERGYIPPKGLGYSYSPYDQLVDVYILFPFNHIVSLTRKLWFKYRHANMVGQVPILTKLWFKYRHVSVNDNITMSRIMVEQSIIEQYNQGYKDGYQRGYDEATKKTNQAWSQLLPLLRGKVLVKLNETEVELNAKLKDGGEKEKWYTKEISVELNKWGKGKPNAKLQSNDKPEDKKD